jgi:exodeoxyribonuclease VII small subunit
MLSHHLATPHSHRLFLLATPFDPLIMAALPPLRQRTRTMSKSSPKSDELSFEDAMQRLDEIVAGMEDGQPTLEEMISSYEEGVGLLKLCRQRIDGARRRVELISGDMEGGKVSLTPFEDGSMDEETEESSVKPRPQLRRRKTTDAESGGEIRLF